MAAEDWIDDWDDRIDPLPPRQKRKAGEWVTARGETIAFRDMKHTHLLNTIAMIERKYRGLQDTFNEGALDIDLLYPQHAGLVAEARRRRLIPKNKKGMVTT